MARCIVDAPCLCLLVTAAAGGRFWSAITSGNPSHYLWPLFPHGGMGAGSDYDSLIHTSLQVICYRWCHLHGYVCEPKGSCISFDRFLFAKGVRRCISQALQKIKKWPLKVKYPCLLVLRSFKSYLQVYSSFMAWNIAKTEFPVLL